MGLTNTRRILKLILKPKPSFEITPSPPDPLFKVHQERPDILWTTSPSSVARNLQLHVQETSFTFSPFNVEDEQDFKFDDILADHCSPLSSRVRQHVYSQMCLKSVEDNTIHDASPTPTPRPGLRRIRRQFSSKSPGHDFCVLKTWQASDDQQVSSIIPSRLPVQHPKDSLCLDQPETTFKHSNKDLSPITEGREAFASPGSLSTMFDSPMGPFAVSASQSSRKSSTASTTNVPFETAHYFTSQVPSFSLGQPGIYPARSSPKLNSANHSMSTAQSSPVSPLVFADVSSFPGQPLNCDVSYGLNVSNFPVYNGNTTIAPDLRDTVPSMSHDPSGPRAPRASPSKRIWSRLRHAVTRAFWKMSNVADVEDSGGSKQGSRATHRMSAPLLTTGASSVRDQDVTRQMRRFSTPARPASFRSP